MAIRNKQTLRRLCEERLQDVRREQILRTLAFESWLTQLLFNSQLVLAAQR
jgi:hypothetical protein